MNGDELGLDQDIPSVPDEPQPVAALLPDPAKITADWQPSEMIDLLKPQDSTTKVPPRALISSTLATDCEL